MKTTNPVTRWLIIAEILFRVSEMEVYIHVKNYKREIYRSIVDLLMEYFCFSHVVKLAALAL
jgi:hypothetical protein